MIDFVAIFPYVISFYFLKERPGDHNLQFAFVYGNLFYGNYFTIFELGFLEIHTLDIGQLVSKNEFLELNFLYFYNMQK